ncbi:MAG: efflux RND transporter periplasmic adaptor subunit [Gammaproteobacteria bacterium]|nr:efflux RND transporter periplasmic adaptor subunit [Gammaproteobacteria bacterium]
MMKQRFRLAVVLVLPLWLSGCGSEHEETAYLRPVRAQQVQYHESVRVARYSGVIVPRREAELSFGTYGRVLRRAVDVGSRFKAGDLLIEIDATDNYEKLASVSARLRAAESTLANANADLKRYQNLLEGRHVSQADYDRQLNLQRVADATVSALKAEEELAKIVILKSRLVALADGVVTHVYVELGQELAPLQAAVRVAYSGTQEALVDLPESALDLAAVGDRVEVSYWALPGVTSEGLIREIAPRADKQSGTYPVRISLPDVDERVRLGMTTEATFSQKPETQVATLPVSALHTTDDGDQAVWVIDTESSGVRLVPVEVVSLEQKQVNIAAGPAVGDWVVTAGVQKLRDGEQVRLLP